MSALTIQARAHAYTVEPCADLSAALAGVTGKDRAIYLVDSRFRAIYREALDALLPADRVTEIEASEPAKSFEALTPVFLDLLARGLKRDRTLVVIGGGVLQDIGCFIASVLSRGLRWELLPTTLLAQADSCIGSKSSINIGAYKNQLGTFYPPHRVMLVSGVLSTLPPDEIRSGLGEVIKLQLLAGEAGYRELMADLGQRAPSDPDILAKWVARSLAVKKPYIESDEFDRGVRNLLNYGHTFGHAYESSTAFAVPHGIAVILGMLTATFVSARLGMVSASHYDELNQLLGPWHRPYIDALRAASLDDMLTAIRHDKKNTGDAVNCILTRGYGRMEKTPVPLAEVLAPAIFDFIAGRPPVLI